jgi:hypothetical protein
MPAIAPDATRRALLLMALAAPLWADAHQAVIDLVTEMASALSEGNGLAFLERVDHAMPGYEKLEQNVLALTSQNEVLSSVEILKDEGDGQSRVVELDWFLQIRSREINGPLKRRREVVKCRVERDKKKWKVKSLEPVGFFAPPAG